MTWEEYKKIILRQNTLLIKFLKFISSKWREIKSNKRYYGD